MEKHEITLTAEDIMSASIMPGENQNNIPVIYGRINGIAYYSEPWTVEGKLLAVLVKRLGGEIEITKAEMDAVKGMWANNKGDSIIVEAD